MTVITGPLFSPNDPVYKNDRMNYSVRCPLQFWKVCVLIRQDDTPAATGFILGQEDIQRSARLRSRLRRRRDANQDCRPRETHGARFRPLAGVRPFRPGRRAGDARNADRGGNESNDKGHSERGGHRDLGARPSLLRSLYPIASSSSIMRSITERPIVQKPGSFASRPNGREQLGIGFRSAGREHREIALGEAIARALVNAVQRVHQAIAERIGVDVERRMDEMPDIGPIGLIAGSERNRGAEAFGLRAHPQLADLFRRQFAVAALEVNERARTCRTRSGAPRC